MDIYIEIKPITGLPLPLASKPKFTGDIKFASKNSFLGCQISKRDDIESLGYMLIYFLRGFLPWENCSDYFSMKQNKLSLSLDDLCKGLPHGIKEFLKYLIV